MFKVAIVCMSDKGSKGEREDISTQVIEKIILENGYKITKKVLIPDDFQKIKDTLIEICDNNHADLILTTGATEEIIEKRVPGIPEAIRAYSLTITKRAMLSRATAGIRKDTLIINMPGSPKAVEESLTYIISELKHGLEILVGSASECARK